MTYEKKAPPGNGASSKSTGGESEANLSKTPAPAYPRNLQNKPTFVSGLGQYHSNEPGAKKRKPYLAVTLADIRAMVDSPPSVPKENGRWFIPSTLASRSKGAQYDTGEFRMLWADLDSNPRPLTEVADAVLYDIVDLHNFEVYASRSAREDYQKGRVFIPLATPLSGADWLLCQKVFNDKLNALGFTPDPVNVCCNQLCYLPNRGEFYESHYLRSGPLFDPLTAWHDEIEVARTQTPEPTARPLTTDDIDGVNDTVLEYMAAGSWPIYGESHDGRKVYVECPNAKQHTNDTGIQSTAWFRAGTNGHTDGGFECLHGHCRDIDTQAFKQAIGYDLHGFDIIETPAGVPRELPAFNRDKNGKIEPTRINLASAIARPDLCGYRLRFDTFLDDLMIAKGTDGGEWVRFNEDVHFYEMALCLENGTTGFKHVPEEMLRRAVVYTCKTQIFDTAQDWLSGLVWDGVPRVADFLTRYAGAETSDYARAASLYWWSALAGRIIEPGVKADMALIAVGVQGKKKSTLVEAMTPAPEFAGELDLSAEKTEIARAMRGKMVMELGELSGFSKRSVEHIKAFISRKKEEWVPKYREFSTTMLRRCLFFGTTNTDEILVDETGNRRWLPFRSSGADPAGLVAVRDQLWAEGAHLFRQHGVLWEAAERLAKDQHAEFTATDPWDSAVREWLYESCMDENDKPISPRADRSFENSDVLSGAVLINIRDQTKALETRMGKILIRFGFERKQERIKKGERGTTDDRSHRWVYRRKENA